MSTGSRGVPACLLMLSGLFVPAIACAETALVAIAANFYPAAVALEAGFERESGHEIRITSGSTGKLYAQIVNGAPFDILLAADRERATLLERSVHGVIGSRFTYAIGALTVWSPDPEAVRGKLDLVLLRPDVRAIAIANPALAPYGAAAKQALQSLGLWDAAEAKIVMGENVGQAHALVATGNAQVGFVALSQVLGSPNLPAGSRRDVPEDLHAPIRQDAVLLAHGADNAAARAFLTYLRSEAAREMIEAHGYRVD